MYPGSGLPLLNPIITACYFYSWPLVPGPSYTPSKELSCRVSSPQHLTVGLSHQSTVIRTDLPLPLPPSSICFRDSLFGPLNHERPCIASVVPDFTSCPWTYLVTSQFYLEKRKERRPATPPAKLSPYWQLGNSVTPRGFTFSLYDLLCTYSIKSTHLGQTGCLSAI